MAREIEFNIDEKQNKFRSKNNERSTKSRLTGNEKVSKNVWREAMKIYNRSICQAIVDSENISLAYANRSLCFLKLKMYDKCLVDIELARNANYPENLMSKLEQRQNHCLECIRRGMQIKKEAPKLDFDDDENFPGMANVLKFQYNEKFGYHLIAKRNIDVGKIVLIEDAYVSTPIMSTAKDVCSNCFKSTMNFISCENCVQAMYCSQLCVENDQFHAISCDNSIPNADHLVPYAVRSVLFALTIFPDIDTLTKFVKNVLNDSKNELPLSTSDAETKYRTFLKLNFDLKDAEKFYQDNRSFHLYVEVMSYPMVKEKIRSKNHERFLMFLSIIHLNILFCNSFQNEVAGFLFLIFKHINYSTETIPPNLLRTVLANKMILTTSRLIKRGAQLCIPFHEKCCVVQTRFKCRIHTELYGKSHIFEMGCNVSQVINAYSWPRSLEYIKSDPEYQYILDAKKRIDYSNDLECTVLKQKCLEFLNKYREIQWNCELRDVSRIFEILAFENNFY